ncbi:hypothetical protein C8J57DRAFT_1295187 [Mycena rebaudengoi]|nr:hypothetical protein C8J57DRAFT_1295187 [Mycena rebaudengoi]
MRQQWPTDHVETHIESLAFPTTKKNPTRHCRWRLEDGEMCMEDHADDWRNHFGLVHSLNVHAKVKLHYCAICPQWYVDELGDGLLWEDHCCEHSHIFAPFRKRVEGDVDHTPIGISYVDNCIEYEVGSGFNGLLAEFHGYVVHGVALVPMYCPFCVFDASLPIEVQMHQFLKNAAYFVHLKTHLADINEAQASNLCPVPSCGTHKFSGHDLLTHLVAFHRVPVCGTTNHTRVRRLRLPDIPPPPEPVVVDLAHLHDGDNDPMDIDAVPPPFSATAKGKKSVIAVARERRAAPANAVIKAHCYGCSHQKDDIGGHLEAAPLEGRCRLTNGYQLVVDGRRTGERLQWVFAEGAPAASSRSSGANHKCVTCRKQFRDIRDHVNDPKSNCNPTSFKIRNPEYTRDKFGDMRDIAGWIASLATNEAGPSKRGVEGSDSEAPPEAGPSSAPQGPSTALPRRPRKQARRMLLLDDDSDSDDGVEDDPEDVGQLLVDAQQDAEPEPENEEMPPPPAPFQCNVCREEFADVEGLASHFRRLRRNSRCRARYFRQREGARWGVKIEWATWAGNTEVGTT